MYVPHSQKPSKYTVQNPKEQEAIIIARGLKTSLSPSQVNDRINRPNINEDAEDLSKMATCHDLLDIYGPLTTQVQHA